MHQNSIFKELTDGLSFTFLKGDNTYIVNGDLSKIFVYINKIINEISIDTSEYVKEYNERLENDLLTRIISRKFFDSVELQDNTIAVIIKVNYNKEYFITVGKLPDPITGVIKYVDSIYIE